MHTHTWQFSGDLAWCSTCPENQGEKVIIYSILPKDVFNDMFFLVNSLPLDPNNECPLTKELMKCQ